MCICVKHVDLLLIQQMSWLLVLSLTHFVSTTIAFVIVVDAVAVCCWCAFFFCFWFYRTRARLSQHSPYRSTIYHAQFAWNTCAYRFSFSDLLNIFLPFDLAFKCTRIRKWELFLFRFWEKIENFQEMQRKKVIEIWKYILNHIIIETLQLASNFL